MAQIKNKEPALPTGPENHGYNGADGTGSGPGLTLRDYFAARAMQGLLSHAGRTACEGVKQNVAHYAYGMADAMMEARDAAE